MDPKILLPRQTLDEDIQMVRVTLEAISDDVRYYSESAAEAVAQAIEKLTVAQIQFER